MLLDGEEIEDEGYEEVVSYSEFIDKSCYDMLMWFFSVVKW